MQRAERSSMVKWFLFRRFLTLVPRKWDCRTRLLDTLIL
ncbi:Uncharacterised protein [Vibrio cholerae]|nr:Uncharacterised protein [Vibrio cholerae]